MFMSTRYKKKDPEWRKKLLFSMDDSLAKLLECMSIEYSVSKLISPKWKNFRSQKFRFESKTRINNAIWRCWHIQYKEQKRPIFFKFDMPFSDQTVHSTPQAVILDGKTWKRRLDIVSREYKKWRKFYNFKILKGDTEETENLKQLSNNSEDEFTSDEEEDNDKKKLRVSPTKTDAKAPVPAQKLFESTNLELDTFLADLPDTLFSSIRPPTVENSLGLTFSDLSDMIQPTLDQLNPCFDELLQNFDFLTSDSGALQNNARSLATVGQQMVAPLQEVINIQHNGGQLQQGLLNTDQMYGDTLGSASTYLYSSEVLYTPNPSAPLQKADSSMENFTSMLSDDSSDQGLQFRMSTKKSSEKRAISETIEDITTSSPPRKIMVKEVDRTAQFLNDKYLQKDLVQDPTVCQGSIQQTLFSGKNDLGSRGSHFETLLSNAMGSSPSQAASSSTAIESAASAVLRTDARNKKVGNNPSAKIAEDSATQILQRKMLVNQTATTKVVEFAELPPQLQAPNLTAHLQAVMSTRSKNPSLPRNKSDTQLSSLEEKFVSPYTVRNTTIRRESTVALATRTKRNVARLPRNMSDTNLVQMAKDSSKVLARRRLSSISVDSKPLILPKNFSDSNLCALGRGTHRRPQPILPKNLIAIVPPAPARITSGISRVSFSQVDTIVAQTTVSGGQFTTFMVSKQQPTSTNPVQVTLYMPKTTKAESVSATTEPPKASEQCIAPPQRVEVIQYKGHQLESQGKQLSVVLPSATVAPSLALSKTQQQTTSFQASFQQDLAQQRISVTNEGSGSKTQSQILSVTGNEMPLTRPGFQPSLIMPMQSEPVRSIAMTSVIQKTSTVQTPYNITTDIVGHSSKGISSTVQQVAPLNNTNMTTVAAVEHKVPVVIQDSDKTESIAPLQGLSEQQLVNLAQILQGSRTGAVEQETTIAYLEVLQKQLNALLVQQQEMLKSQPPTSENNQISSANPSGSVLTSSIPDSQSFARNVYSAPTSSCLDVQQKAHTPSVEKVSAPFARIAGSQSFQVSGMSEQKVTNVSKLAIHPEAEMLLDGNTRSTISLTSSIPMKKQKRQQHNQSQASARINPAPPPISTQIFMPKGDNSLSVGSRTSTIVVPVHDNTVNQSVTYQTLPGLMPSPQPAGGLPHQTVLQFPYGSSASQLPVVQSVTGSAQQQVIVGVQSSPHFSTLDSSGVGISIAQALGNSLVSNIKFRSSSEPLLPGSTTIAIPVDSTVTKASARPTMVDLAIAASQRTYLTDKLPSLETKTLEGSAAATSTDDLSTSVVSCVVQAIPTIAASDSPASIRSDANNAKRSRLRFEDREVYKEYRRKNHVTAEQKRRGLIKVAFDQLISLIPSLQNDKQGRTSKALVLQKAVDYIDHLQREKELTKYKIEKARREVNRLNEEIKICQQKLPAGGAISEQENNRDAKTSYLELVRGRIVTDPKYWLFSVLLRPLFESYNKKTVTKTLQEFIQSVLKWFEEHCSLPVLRPAVIGSLRQISTDTAILSDPGSLPDQAMKAANSQDPTILGPHLQVTTKSQQVTTRVQMHPEVQGSTVSSLIGSQNTVLIPTQTVRWQTQPRQ
ncbi:uncharacterized protein LOC135683680 isoform X2 [Rhopilema esculentum]|uniref:uncharacterized protein LOC135683680 isoform X2 n=1 Tax=Rhopilema esculentum TaxID=499914 RepID=UPI0031CE13A3